MVMKLETGLATPEAASALNTGTGLRRDTGPAEFKGRFGTEPETLHERAKAGGQSVATTLVLRQHGALRTAGDITLN